MLFPPNASSQHLQKSSGFSWFLHSQLSVAKIICFLINGKYIESVNVGSGNENLSDLTFFPISTETLLFLNTYVGWQFKSQWFNLYIRKRSSLLYHFFNSINLLQSVLPFEIVLILFVWHSQAFGLLYSRLHLILYHPATWNKLYIFELRLFLQDVSWQPPLFLTNALALLASKSVDQNDSETFFLQKKETSKNFLLSLWHSKEHWQLAIYRSPLKPLLFSLNGPQCLTTFVESKRLSKLISTSKQQLLSVSNGSLLVWLMLVYC